MLKWPSNDAQDVIALFIFSSIMICELQFIVDDDFELISNILFYNAIVHITLTKCFLSAFVDFNP